MRDSFFKISKWAIGILLPFVFGAIAWAAKVENRISVVESTQSQVLGTLVDIRSDIREVRNVLLDKFKNEAR